MMTTVEDAARHREVTEAVHAAGTGSKIAMQILHTGRYGYHPFTVVSSKPEKDLQISPWSSDGKKNRARQWYHTNSTGWNRSVID